MICGAIAQRMSFGLPSAFRWEGAADYRPPNRYVLRGAPMPCPEPLPLPPEYPKA